MEGSDNGVRAFAYGGVYGPVAGHVTISAYDVFQDG